MKDKLPSYWELLESLVDMVNQHCVMRDKEVVYDMGLSANEVAIELLERCGVAVKADRCYNWYRLDYAVLEELKNQVKGRKT